MLYTITTYADQGSDNLKAKWEVLAAEYEKGTQDFPRYAVRDRQTPWLPENWPIESSTKFVRYFYARSYTVPPSIVDGEQIIAPWAKEYFKNGTKEIITNRLEDLGIQGFRPLSKEEDKILSSEVLPDKFTAASSKELRGYYCLWISLNSVLWERIKERHQEFDAWLNCR